MPARIWSAAQLEGPHSNARYTRQLLRSPRALYFDREQQTAGPDQDNELTPFKVEHGDFLPDAPIRAADWPVLSLPQPQPAAGWPASPWGKPEMF